MSTPAKAQQVLDQAAISADDDFTTAFLRDPTATIVGMTTEHILLDAGRTEVVVEETVEPAAVKEHVIFENKVRGVTIELAFLEDGFLNVSAKRRHGAGREYAVHLRYLDPRPRLLRTNSGRTRMVAIAFAGAGLASSALAYLMPSWVAALFAVGIWAGAGAAIGFHIYLKHERVAFVTRHGQAVVLALHANFGCLRRCRALVPKIVAAIRDSSKGLKPSSDQYLREEMREHYRLREAGVISGAECTVAARRVLSQFN